MSRQRVTRGGAAAAIVMIVVAVVAVALAGAGCVVPARSEAPRPISGVARLIDSPQWSISVLPPGKVVVEADDCMVRTEITYANTVKRGTRRCPIERMFLITPWGSRLKPLNTTRTLKPISTKRAHAEFAVDWINSSIDPLDPRTHGAAAAGWKIDATWLKHPIIWRPSPATISQMIELSGRARGIETEVVAGGPPPELVVEGFDVVGDALLGGATSELVLTVANRGAGSAYRVVALTRSSLAEVHNLQLSFGTIAPGARETRRILVRLPASIEDPDAMLVLEFAEANHNAPRNFSRRFTIRPLSTTPKLSLACQPRGGDADREVDAGEVIHLICRLGNDGVGAASQVVLDVKGGSVPARFVVAHVAAAAAVSVDLAVQVPRTARLDERIVFEIVAQEPTFGRRVAATVEVVVQVPQVCPRGRLTRAAYRAKRAELVAARDAGELTAAEFDSYDAELVGCLQ